jgi:hypothetical protein
MPLLLALPGEPVWLVIILAIIDRRVHVGALA